jgi:hypothetical protein
MKSVPLLLITSLPLTLLAYPDGSRVPNGNAGEPGSGTPCASCHRVALNPAGGKVELTLPAGSTYRTGEKQTWTVRITDPNTSRRYGFQLTASAGSFTAGGNTVVNTSGAKPYINQRSSSATYTFDWTPPASGLAAVNVYVAGVACNGRNDTNAYTLSQTLSAATALPAIKSDSGIVSAASYAAGDHHLRRKPRPRRRLPLLAERRDRRRQPPHIPRRHQRQDQRQRRRTRLHQPLPDQRPRPH